MRKEVPLILDNKNDKMFLINQYRFSDPAFKITVTVTAGGTFTLPLRAGYTYNFVANWGDGTADSTITAYNDADITHTYTNAGDYQISMVGVLESFYFNNGGDRLRLKKVDAWGSVGMTTLGFAFSGCANLLSIPNEPIPYVMTGNDLFRSLFRNCTNLAGSIPTDLFKNSPGATGSVFFETFLGCAALTGSIPTDLFRYQASNTSFVRTFYGCTNLNGTIPLDLFRYNTLVISFLETFNACINLDVISEDLFYYNSAATGYSGTFIGCRNLVLPVRMFNLSNLSIVTSFANFMDVTSTSHSPTGTVQDIWNYTTATSTNAFDQCTALTNYASIPVAWT